MSRNPLFLSTHLSLLLQSPQVDSQVILEGRTSPLSLFVTTTPFGFYLEPGSRTSFDKCTYFFGTIGPSSQVYGNEQFFLLSFGRRRPYVFIVPSTLSGFFSSTKPHLYLCLSFSFPPDLRAGCFMKIIWKNPDHWPPIILFQGTLHCVIRYRFPFER